MDINKLNTLQHKVACLVDEMLNLLPKEHGWNAFFEDKAANIDVDFAYSLPLCSRINERLKRALVLYLSKGNELVFYVKKWGMDDEIDMLVVHSRFEDEDNKRIENVMHDWLVGKSIQIDD